MPPWLKENIIYKVKNCEIFNLNGYNLFYLSLNILFKYLTIFID